MLHLRFCDFLVNCSALYFENNKLDWYSDQKALAQNLIDRINEEIKFIKGKK